MNTIALIPARRGSKRCENKALRNCGGHPMIAWSIRAALEAHHPRYVYVSTEDAEIAEVARRYGADVIERPVELATDTASTEQVIAHAVETWHHTGVRWDACVLLQPTSPLRWKDRVDEACVMLATHSTVVSVSRDPLVYFAGTIDGEGRWHPRYGDRPRTQDIPLYRENGAIFGWTREHWERTGTRMGPMPGAIVLDPHEDLDVDTEHDLQRADERCTQHQFRRRQRIPWPLPERRNEPTSTGERMVIG